MSALSGVLLLLAFGVAIVVGAAVRLLWSAHKQARLREQLPSVPPGPSALHDHEQRARDVERAIDKPEGEP